MACGRLPRHLSNIHIQNIRAILPILGFPNRRFRRWKSFACSGLDASPVTSSNPIPNLESKSSKIGKFETTQSELFAEFHERQKSSRIPRLVPDCQLSAAQSFWELATRAQQHKAFCEPTIIHCASTPHISRI